MQYLRVTRRRTRNRAAAIDRRSERTHGREVESEATTRSPRQRGTARRQRSSFEPCLDDVSKRARRAYRTFDVVFFVRTHPSGERESGSYSGTRQRNRLKVVPSQESSSGQPKRTRRRRREIREEFSFLHKRSSSMESSSREIWFGTRRAPQLQRCPDLPLGP